MIPGNINTDLISGADEVGYQVTRSLRFNSADSAYLSRTPASAGNRKTWTWAGWVKKVKNESILPLLNARQSSSDFLNIWFDSGDGLFVRSRVGGSDSFYAYTAAVFRDPSAWYHVLIAVDTIQASGSNGVKVYVNGTQQTLTIPTYNQNADTFVNSTFEHRIGYLINQNSSTYYLDSYLADLHLIDGQALTPSSFAETNATTGQWVPKAYTGSYGTNGFRLDFSDNSAATATTLGKDRAGSNNWTPNNLSVTAGAGNDSLVDTPTSYGTDTGAGGEVRGNYATLNPLTSSGGTYSQGNLRFAGPSDYRRSNGTIAVSTGKWYWEVTLANDPYSPRTSSSQWNAFGFGLSSVSHSTTASSAVTDAVVLQDNGYFKNFSSSVTDVGTAFSSGDVLSCAVDLDANTFTFRRNNTQVATGTIGGTAGRELVPIIISYSDQYGVMDCNFGARPFAYQAPAGYKCLCDTSLPLPVVAKSSDYFQTVLYTGNGSTQKITTAFSPDLVWIKSRGIAYWHRLNDSVRGVQKFLYSNATDAEGTSTTNDKFNSFDSDGFTLGSATDTGADGMNQNGLSYVAWTWDAGSSTVTNTQGSITSSCRTNQSSGFSIATFTAPSSGSATIGHGLGVEPHMIIIKSRDQAYNWCVYHKALTSNAYFLNLNTTAAQSNASNIWNNTTPTSTVFSLGSGYAGAGATVAYLFSPVAGYSSFGSYTGNGSTDGPFVYTGHRVRWLLVKNATNGGSWVLHDTTRSTYNVSGQELLPDSSGAEYTFTRFDFLSNGFKGRSTNNASNTNGDTYIYAAFAENPFQYARAR